jgi:hypothetical protein
VVIVDEISMLEVGVLQEMDKKLQVICGVQLPFGGKVVVLGGDRMQLPPPMGEHLSIFASYYMQLFHHFLLTQQMRQIDDPDYTAWLRKVNG